MPDDPALVAEVRAWLSKAGKDLGAAGIRTNLFAAGS